MSYYSILKYTGDGSTKQFLVTFPYISKDHVTATVDGLPASFTWVDAGRIEFAVAPATGKYVVLTRKTPMVDPLVSFVNGSILSDIDLNKATQQSLMISQEVTDSFVDLQERMEHVVSAEGNVPLPVDPTDNYKVLEAYGGGFRWQPTPTFPSATITTLASTTINVATANVSGTTTTGTLVATTGNITTGTIGTLTVSGTATVGTLNVTTETVTTLTVTNITFAGLILPDTTNTHDLGSSLKQFKDLYLAGKRNTKRMGASAWWTGTSIASGTEHASGLTLQAGSDESNSTPPMWPNSSGPITCRASGMYLVEMSGYCGGISGADNATGVRVLKLFVNGGATRTYTVPGSPYAYAGVTKTEFNTTYLIALNAGDTLTMDIIQTSGAAKDIGCTLSVYRLDV